jgi:phosphoribosylamine--glycine ligase
MGIDNPVDVLVIGSGGREHAIAWKLRQSPGVGRLYAAPGNAGTAEIGENLNLRDSDIPGLLGAVRSRGIGLTVVGPEGPLAAGCVDAFRADGRLVFGPTQAAARLESSKAWAKLFMGRHGIPTAKAAAFRTAPDAIAYIDRMPENTAVIKADGLAAGKGVVVANTRAEARDAVSSVFSGAVPSSAISQVLVEERLVGTEVSVFAFVDGGYVSEWVAACDYKRVGDNDTGPNTGGMGAYSPPEFWTQDLARTVRKEILEPVAAGMVSDGSPFTGVLYAGLMLTREGPKVIEFNCRLGDPEAQVILPRLHTDLFEILLAGAQGRLRDVAVDWSGRPHVCVVLASGGYPGKYRTGVEVKGIAQVGRGAVVFHAGTKRDGDRIVTNGGRVLAVAAGGADIGAARSAAYEGVSRIAFEGMIFRRDIAQRAAGRSHRIPLPRPGGP